MPAQEAQPCWLSRPGAPDYPGLSAHHLRGGTQSPTLLPREVLTLKPDGTHNRLRGWPGGSSPRAPVRDFIAIQAVALSPGTHGDAPVLSPKVQLRGQGLNVVPGVKPGTLSVQAPRTSPAPAPHQPRPSPTRGSLRKGVQGSTGRGAYRRKVVSLVWAT